MRLKSGWDMVVRGPSKRAQRLLSVFFRASGVKGLADLDRPACRLYAPWRAFRRCGLSELQFGGLGGWAVLWASGYGSRFPAIERKESRSIREVTRRAVFSRQFLVNCQVRGELLLSTEEHGGTRRAAFLFAEGRRGAERASLRLSAAVDIAGPRPGGGCRFLLLRRGRRWCGRV